MPNVNFDLGICCLFFVRYELSLTYCILHYTQLVGAIGILDPYDVHEN